MIHTNLDYGKTWHNVDNDSRHWRYGMEETIISSNLTPKPWVKLTADEKIERLREQLKQERDIRKNEMRQAWEQIEALREVIYKQNRKPDEEYF